MKVPDERRSLSRRGTSQISPPYDWNRTYMATKGMEEYLPDVPLAATVVQVAEDGFDVVHDGPALESRLGNTQR